MYELIIFDCDGVLVDSEKLAAEVFSVCLQQHQVDWDAEKCLTRFKGLTLPNCLQLLRSEEGVVLDENFLAQLKSATTERFDRDLRPIPGISDVLEHLSEAQRPFCVASNGHRDKILHTLKTVSFDSYFGSAIFSAEQVAKGKPEPDLFLLAAETYGVSPQFCCVIEDSKPGVTAAIAAGMDVILFQEREFSDDINNFGETHRISSMTELHVLLG